MPWALEISPLCNSTRVADTLIGQILGTLDPLTITTKSHMLVLVTGRPLDIIKRIVHLLHSSRGLTMVIAQVSCRILAKIAVIVILLLSGLVIYGCRSDQSNTTNRTENPSGSLITGGLRPPPPMWQLQPDQLVQDTKAGPFRFLMILNKQDQQQTILLYSLAGKHREPPQVVSETPTVKVVSVEVLGEVNGFEIGAVHLQWQDQPDQQVSLTFSLNESQAKWEARPLRQTGNGENMPRKEYYDVPESIAANAPIVAANYGGTGLANIKVAKAPGTGQSQTALLLHVDDNSTISVVSEEEFAQAIAPMPTLAPLVTEPLPTPLPATYAPTPTLMPYPQPNT